MKKQTLTLASILLTTLFSFHSQAADVVDCASMRNEIQNLNSASESPTRKISEGQSSEEAQKLMAELKSKCMIDANGGSNDSGGGSDESASGSGHPELEGNVKGGI